MVAPPRGAPPHSSLEIPLYFSKSQSKTETTQWEPYIGTKLGPSYKIVQWAFLEKSPFQFMYKFYYIEICFFLFLDKTQILGIMKGSLYQFWHDLGQEWLFVLKISPYKFHFSSFRGCGGPIL